MSHVTKLELHVKDLKALAQAAKTLGLELREGQTTFRWYGKTPGKCEHALVLPNNPHAYEVGIRRRTDDKPGYMLVGDFDMHGGGLRDAIGQRGNKLRATYAETVATTKVRAKGFRINRTVTATGKVVLRATR